MVDLTTLEFISKNNNSPFAKRLLAQTSFAIELSKANDNAYDDIIEAMISFLQTESGLNDILTEQVLSIAEDMLLPLQGTAKQYTMFFAGHAHIDMNWMWRMDETVVLTIETIKTMLKLMEEYPSFTFSQSQASVYKIIEEFAPELLPKIKERIREGRWEITAGAWVESDKNMISGESMIRQILYTKRYLGNLLDVDPETINLDFQPDTFGHSIHVPEILASAGIEYYYHCRGYDGHNIYRFRAPSGKDILVYREANWYNQAIEADAVLYLPEFARKNAIKAGLRVYGTGNHGGGPTRRDIEKIIEMQSWPIFPVIRFGSVREYFGLIEKIEKIPVVDHELNFIFDGCYTSQTRIKSSNRIGEQKLYEAECLTALSAISGTDSGYSRSMAETWEKLLFNQFHDILPGSGTIDTREYAMGKFQELLSSTNSSVLRSLQEISSAIDTEKLIPRDLQNRSTSYGAGVGFGTTDFSCPQTNRSEGLYRIYHIFNTLPYQRDEWVMITVWDWPGDLNRLKITDSEGKSVPFQIIDGYDEPGIIHSYWQHVYFKVLIRVKVKSFGYNTIIVSEKVVQNIHIPVSKEPIIDEPINYILENECLKAVFDPMSIALSSLVNKKCGVNVIGKAGCCFHLIEEDNAKGMSAWRIGRYMSDKPLTENVTVTGTQLGKELPLQWIKYKICFNESFASVTVSLKQESDMLEYNVDCDWKEMGTPFDRVPQLSFSADIAYQFQDAVFDVPMGSIIRKTANHDVPALSFACGINKKDYSLALLSKTKYGYRAYNGKLSLSLIRSSYDPDPNPETGKHLFQFALCVDNPNPSGLTHRSKMYNYPLLPISGTPKQGSKPPEMSIFTANQSENIVLSSLKKSEDNQYFILRFYECMGEEAELRIPFTAAVGEAFITDSNENIIEDIPLHNNTIRAVIRPYSILTVKIKIRE